MREHDKEDPHMNRLLKIAVLSVGAAVLLAVAAVAAYLLTRGDAPDEVDLETAVARIETADTAEDGTGASSDAEAVDDSGAGTGSAGALAEGDEDADAASGADRNTDAGTADAATGTDADAGTAGAGTDVGAAADTTDAGAASGAVDHEAASDEDAADGPAGLAGVWTVEAAEDAGDLQDEPAVSFAGFRVDEVLDGGIGNFTAVGRTADVSGSIELSDTALVAATVEVTMGTLRTDSSSRDSQVRRALGTADFPVTTFTLAEPVALPAGMADGEAFSGSAEGDLTIKGVTNRVAFDLQAQLVGDVIVAVGSSDVVFSDYGVTAPTAPIVLSVENHGIMEFQLVFTR